MKRAEIALRRVTRVIGITALSAELGVGRQHLYKVISGERRSGSGADPLWVGG